jgi:ribonuclease HI
LKTPRSDRHAVVLGHLARTLDIPGTLDKFGISEEELRGIILSAAGEDVKPGKVHALTIRFDGASKGNPGESAAGYLIERNGEILKEGSVRLGVMTNNQAEYEALILALSDALTIPGAGDLTIYSDSSLVVNGNWKINHPALVDKFWKVRDLLKKFKSCKLTHVPREQNAAADRLANKAYLKS